jgi:hypothetical protein
VNLLSIPLTVPVSLTVGGVVKTNAAPRNLTVQANFVYVSGGASVDVWLQTSLDSGNTWSDIAQFHLTTASARKAVNLNAQTPQTTQISLTDGAMAANTAQDGILGAQFRAKYQSSGTYANTSLSIDLQCDQFGAFN